MKNEMTSKKTTIITSSALLIAMTAICSWISVPIPGTAVPINLATFAVMLTGIMLGRKYGALAITVYVILGAIGVPVFHGFTGGAGIVAGPTGGFIIGYIFLALIMGFYCEKKLPFIPAAVIGEAVLYAFGVLWFTCLSGASFAVAAASCVLPFIPGDIAKTVLVYFVQKRLKKSLPSLF